MIRLHSSFLVTARPTDAKIELLMRQMKLTKEQVELCIQTDPSPNQTDYVTWLGRWLSKGIIRLPEDAQDLRESLLTFSRIKRQPGFTGNKDVNAYDPAHLSQVIQQNAMTVVRSKDVEKFRGLKGVSLFAQKGEISIFKIEKTPGGKKEYEIEKKEEEPVTPNVKALMILSDGTDWCTRHLGRARQYLSMGPSFVVFYEGLPFGQLHPSSSQYKDKSDLEFLKEFRGPDIEGKAGWGHRKMRPGEIIGTGIANPVAVEALEMMKKDPEVYQYVIKEKIMDPQTLAVKLKGTQHWLESAILSGVPLTTEQEDHLATEDPERLKAYAQKFHPQGRWAPLEKSLLTHMNRWTRTGKAEAVTYAQKRIKGRWPELEAIILRQVAINDMCAGDALNYAVHVVKGRWPELESRFSTTKSTDTMPKLAARYAYEVLKVPWRDVHPQKIFSFGMVKPEVTICRNFLVAIEYAHHWGWKSWPLLGDSLKSENHFELYINYLSEVEGKDRDPELEAFILNPSPHSYSRRVPLESHERSQWRHSHPSTWIEEQGRWVEDPNVNPPSTKVKEFTTNKDVLGIHYAKTLLRRRWPELEERLLKEILDTTQHQSFSQLGSSWGNDSLPDKIESYLIEVVKGRWPELETTLLQRYRDHPDRWTDNQAFVNAYLNKVKPMVNKESEVPVWERYDQQKVPVVGIWPEGEAALTARSPAHEKMLEDDIASKMAPSQRAARKTCGTRGTSSGTTSSS